MDRTSPAYRKAKQRFAAILTMVQAIVSLTPTTDDDFYMSLLVGDDPFDKFNQWWDRTHPAPGASMKPASQA